MKNSKVIIEGIREVVGKDIEILQGKVIAVHEDSLTVDIELEPDVVRYNVRLRAVVDDDTGLYLLPAMKSYCTIAKIEGGQEHVLIKTSKLDKVILKIKEQSIHASADGFVFNEGKLKGLVKIDDLVSKLNALENKVNNLITWSSTHMHTGVTTGTGTSGTAVGVTGTLTNTTIKDLENPKIKQ